MSDRVEVERGDAPLRVRVVTWNVHSCVGSDGRFDAFRVADVLASLDADVIGLQEVDSRRGRTGGVAQLELLAERLGMHAIAGPNLIEHDGDFGNGVLSRREAATSERIDLSVDGAEPRGAIDARWRLEGGDLRVIVTHLGLRHAERTAQLSRLGRLLDEGPAAAATVLMGDYNDWRPRAWGRVGLGRDRIALHARPRSFPSRLPALRLDRVLATPRPSRADVRVPRAGDARMASDHLPVVADLEWPTGPRETA